MKGPCEKFPGGDGGGRGRCKLRGKKVETAGFHQGGENGEKRQIPRKKKQVLCPVKTPRGHNWESAPVRTVRSAARKKRKKSGGLSWLFRGHLKGGDGKTAPGKRPLVVWKEKGEAAFMKKNDKRTQKDTATDQTNNGGKKGKKSSPLTGDPKGRGRKGKGGHPSRERKNAPPPKKKTKAAGRGHRKNDVTPIVSPPVPQGGTHLSPQGDVKCNGREEKN